MNHDLYSLVGDNRDAADELLRIPLAAAIGAFSGALFGVSCLIAAAVYAFKG